MKKLSRWLKAQLIAPMLCGAAMTAFTSSTLADDSTTLSQISCGSDTTNCLVHGYGTPERIMMFQPTYDQLQSMLSGSFVGSILQPNLPNSLTPTMTFNGGTDQSLMTLLTSQGMEPQNVLKTVPGFLAKQIVIDPAGNSKSVSVGTSEKALNTLNLESLLSPMVYRTIENSDGSPVNQQLVAQSYIIYATGLANPMQTLDFSSIKYPTDKYSNLYDYLKDAQKSSEVATYLMNLRIYAAQQATGISNLFQLYYERLPITDPTTLQQAISVMTPPPGSSLSQPPPPNQLSILQMQQYLATRRINDNNWYAQMQNATPATLTREILYLLAELPPMLFQLHLDLERLIATASVAEIQQTAGSRLNVEQSRDNANGALQSSSSTADTTTQDQLNDEQQQQAAQATSDQTGDTSATTGTTDTTDTTNSDITTSQ